LVEITPRSSARLVADSVSLPVMVCSSRKTMRSRVVRSRSAVSGLWQMTNLSSAGSGGSRTSLTCSPSATVRQRPARDRAAFAAGLSLRSFSPRM